MLTSVMASYWQIGSKTLLLVFERFGGGFCHAGPQDNEAEPVTEGYVRETVILK